MEDRSRVVHGQDGDISRDARARREPLELPREYLAYCRLRKAQLLTQVRYGPSMVRLNR